MPADAGGMSAVVGPGEGHRGSGGHVAPPLSVAGPAPDPSYTSDRQGRRYLMFQATRWSRWAVAAGLLSLSACGGGGSSPTSPSSMAKTVTVQIVDFAFNPKDVTINPG